HLQFGVKRVIIFDIDLHHGNGTQAIAWAINAETNRNKVMQEANRDFNPEGGIVQSLSSTQGGTQGLQIFYASLHDILSFPCEDGDPTLVRDASVSIAGAHGQYIENIHLQPYASHEEFWNTLYPYYRTLFSKALNFIKSDPQDTNVPIFISCGFDASELEYESMSRHGRKVPVGFYYRFTKDAKAFAAEFSNGKVVSVLEGGYSDRTLMAGGMAHLAGLVEDGEGTLRGPEGWWSDINLDLLEKACKKRKGRQSVGKPVEQWVERSVEILAAIDPHNGPPPPSPPGGSRKSLFPINQPTPSAPSPMLLRERRKPQTPPPDTNSNLPPPSGNSRPRNSGSGRASPARKVETKPSKQPESGGEPPKTNHEFPSVKFEAQTKPEPSEGPSTSTLMQTPVPATTAITGPPQRKLPKIILRVREPES
ncbi:hypothetical protein FRC15_006459, partial [Serendipita sp. 397]